MRPLHCFAVLVALIAVPAFAEEFVGKVVGVTNGNTIRVLRNKKEVIIRLDAIDCPESPQAFGDKAKEAVSDLTLEKTVTVQEKGKDNNGRVLADIVLPDGKYLNQELVRTGFAWCYKRLITNESLGKMEMEARVAHLGLWADNDATAPWEWRQRDSKPGPKAPPPIAVEPNGLNIVALLPDPVNRDSGHEEITLENSTGQEVNLKGWAIQSRRSEDSLTGTISPKSKRVIKLSKEMLLNGGNEVLLIDRDRVVRSLVSYSGREVKVGGEIDFQK